MPTNFNSRRWFSHATRAVLVCTGLLVLPFLLSYVLGISTMLSQLLGSLLLGAVGALIAFLGLMLVWMAIEAVVNVTIGVRCALKQVRKL
jgi:hypothetical protein